MKYPQYKVCLLIWNIHHARFVSGIQYLSYNGLCVVWNTCHVGFVNSMNYISLSLAGIVHYLRFVFSMKYTQFKNLKFFCAIKYPQGLRLYSQPPLKVHSTQTQWDNLFIHSCEWVRVWFGIHRSRSHSSDPQKLSDCWVKSTPPSSATHLFGLFIHLKFCFKKWIIWEG